MADTAKFTFGYLLSYQGVVADSVAANFSVVPDGTVLTRRIIKGTGSPQSFPAASNLYARAFDDNNDTATITSGTGSVDVGVGRWVFFAPTNPASILIDASVGDKLEVIGLSDS